MATAQGSPARADGEGKRSQFQQGLGASGAARVPLGGCKHSYVIANADNSWTRAPYTRLSKDKTEKQLSGQTWREKVALGSAASTEKQELFTNGKSNFLLI